MDTKYLTIHWGDRYPEQPRRWRVRHNRRAKSVYVQALWLEVVVWYG